MLELYLGGGLLDLRGRVDRDARGLDARRRHGRQLHELHPHARAHPRGVGASTALVGLDDPGYERDHIDAVWERLDANTEATRQNGTHQQLMEGLDALGSSTGRSCATPTLDDDPEFCGYCSHGLPARLQALDDEDLAAGRLRRRRRAASWLPAPTGSWSRTAARPASQATVTHADGSTTSAHGGGADGRGRLRARSSRPRCCCARGIGGPAVGKHLRLHPAYSVNGIYDEPIEGWRGQIQSLVSDTFAEHRGRLRLPDRGDGDGFPACGARRCLGRRRGPQAADDDAALAWRRSSAWPRDHG